MKLKLAKSGVRYRRARPHARRRCGNCVMFRDGQTRGSPGTCTLVQGPILPGDVCDRWAAE